MKNKVFRKGWTVAIIVLFIGMSVIPSTAITVEKKSIIQISNSNTLYVGGTGEGNYTSIQDAIDNANDEDTVFVYDDSSPYNEHIIVDKSINLIGEDKNTTIIDGGFLGGIIVKIEDIGIYLSEFTIQNSGNHPPNKSGYGIEINNHETHIYGNIIKNCWFGIYLNRGNNIIEDNKIVHNTYGIFIENIGGFDNLIINNIIAHNKRDGLCDKDRDFGTVATWNVIADNGKIQGGCGIYKHDSYSVYHHNDFFFNSCNAVVNGGRYGNTWDDGSEGNYWDDWEYNPGYPDYYEIPSSLSEEIDYYPNTNPYMDSFVVSIKHYPYYALVDEPIDFIAHTTLDPFSVSWFWDFGDGNISNEIYPTYSYSSTGHYYISVTITDNLGNSDTSKSEVYIGRPPEKPTIAGPIWLKLKVRYHYNISCIDPDGDDIYYNIDWGDDYESIGPFKSGETIEVSHMWYIMKWPCITVTPVDTADLVGETAILEVYFNRNRAIVNQLSSQQSTNPLFLQILQRLMNNI